MGKKSDPAAAPVPAETVIAEAVPLAVVTREPSDEEMIAELEALQAIALKRALVGMVEYDHCREHISAAVHWLRRIVKKSS